MHKWVLLGLLGTSAIYGAQTTQIYNRLALHNQTGVHLKVTATSQTNPPRSLGIMGPEKSILVEYPYTHGSIIEALTAEKLSVAVTFGTLTQEAVAAFAIVVERNKLLIKPCGKEEEKQKST